jgi:1,2-diacylglycerol 3-alpha-glucosyltransferase
MKILLVADQFFKANNGMTISARRFAKVLEEHGNEVRIVSTGTEEDVEPGKTAYLMKKQYIPLFDRLVSAQGMTFAKTDLPLLEEAVRWADVVHFLVPFALSKHGAELCRKRGVPYTAAFHVQPENISSSLHMGKIEGINNLIYRWFRWYFYRYVKCVHCPSRFIAEELVQHGYDNDIHVISNGIDPDFVYAKQEKRQRLAGTFTILSVGRYSIEKRQDVLIDAVKASRYSDRIQIVLAGKGPREKKLRRRARGLANPIIMEFFSKDELLDIMAESDLYVHCADAEIEAMACMEAFARGLVPVIADSAKSATPQFALTDKSLFRQGDPADLAKHIDYFIEHESERREWEKKYAASADRYRLDRCVFRAEEMFRAAIAEKEQEELGVFEGHDYSW